MDALLVSKDDGRHARGLLGQANSHSGDFNWPTSFSLRLNTLISLVQFNVLLFLILTILIFILMMSHQFPLPSMHDVVATILRRLNYSDPFRSVSLVTSRHATPSPLLCANCVKKRVSPSLFALLISLMGCFIWHLRQSVFIPVTPPTLTPLRIENRIHSVRNNNRIRITIE